MTFQLSFLKSVMLGFVYLNFLFITSFSTVYFPAIFYADSFQFDANQKRLTGYFGTENYIAK